MTPLLIVEDETTFREFMSLALKMEGYDVRSVGDGETALQVLADETFDLVLLDLSMPNLSGWEVLRYIRADHDLHSLPVVLLTANADEETRRRSAQEHVNRLLIKPVSLEEILDVLQALLG